MASSVACEQTQMVSPIVSMTLGNMRSLGVPALLLTCQACGYELRLNVDARSDDVAVSSFGLNLRCPAVVMSVPTLDQIGVNVRESPMGAGRHASLPGSIAPSSRSQLRA
jgi:hypothetical protein